MLLWADGFDHYGLDETNMTDGPYAQAESVALSTTFKATGTHSLHINGNGSSTSFSGLRKVLPATKTKMGVACRLYFPGFNTSNYFCTPIDFLSDSPIRSQIAVVVDGNGAFRFLRGNWYGAFSELGTLLATTDPLLVADAWNHVEVQVYSHDSAGWIRVAVNGVDAYELTGVDTAYNANGIVSVGHHNNADQIFGSNANRPYVDDLFYYDFVGDDAVDTDFCPQVDGSGKAISYIGELQCMYLPPDGDTAEADWAKSSGSDGFALIDEVTPNDADYVYSAAAADLSEFALTDLPPEITYVRGLQLLGRMSKSDSGVAMTKFGMKSVAATDDAAERPVTVEPTYWWDFMNVDPNSGARWTRTSLNAAWFRLTRSA